MSLCSLSRRLSLSTRCTRSRFLSWDSMLSKRHISCLSISQPTHLIHTTYPHHHSLRTFCSNSSGDNNDIPSTPNLTNTLPNPQNERIYNEAMNQKSLVKATGKNKSLVPYINQVLIVPVQKPLFPGFSSILYLKDATLKRHFIQSYRKRMEAQYNKDNKIENAKDIINSSEWIGLFLNNPKTSPITREEELDMEYNEQSTQELAEEPIEPSNTEEATTIAWHPALDEVNSDMHHYVESIPTDMDDIFEYGVLAKIDFNDESTNIGEFIRLENEANGVVTPPPEPPKPIKKEKDKENRNKKQNKTKNVSFPVSRWEDPLVLKVIGARRIKLDSVCIPNVTDTAPVAPSIMRGNIEHLQPSMDIKKPETGKVEAEVINDTASEIQTRSAFNVASDLLRRLYFNDPDGRRDMIQLWSARHHIDIGFFSDFAASITNSTPRELQQLLECVDYGERLELLCKLLKREEEMMKKREEIISRVDALMKKEDESNYLKMILLTTQKRLMLNHREKQVMSYQYHSNNKGNAQSMQPPSQMGGPNVVGEPGGDGSTEEKKDRYQRLAAKFQDRVKGKRMSAEAKELFDEGIEKLTGARNRESLDIETTKQYLDWISSLPWNTYSIDNDNIKKAREILEETHYGMKLVKERILEVIACNILRGELNLNDKPEEDDAGEEEEVDDIVVNKNNEEVSASKILCLIGPPGTGKTSIGSSIAKSLNRAFFKFSLGGSDDSHLLKGFLRTYAGSQPGKLIYGLRQCQTANPMILIDEIDKMGARHSDPSHALLEILDPSQNNSFSDNYLDFAVDLSRVLFVCTANDESKIDPVLRDRLHIIRLNGYDEHEKLEIAKRYLIPNALKKCGLKTQNIHIPDNVITELIKWYSRESGVRSLAQNIERICSKSTLQLAEAGVTFQDIHHDVNHVTDTNHDTCNIDSTNDDGSHGNVSGTGNQKRSKKILETLSGFVKRIASDHDTEPNVHTTEIDSTDTSCETSTPTTTPHEIPFVSIDSDNLKDYVGLRKYENDRTYMDEKSTPCGVVTGLAYTTNGGCITYVETIKYRKHSPSSGEGNGGSIKSTGQLGKVMSESVEIAQCVARALLSNKIDANNRFFDDYNIHLHCPQGGIPKDGPSAGVTMVTALLSLALNTTVSPNVAMTGECTLTGKVLKIGGLREKLLAAKRSKITTLILPFDNLDDFYDDEFGVPKYLRDEFEEVHFVKTYDEILHILFGKHLITTTDDMENNEDCNRFPQHMDDLTHSPEMPNPL
eukprot:111633_1